MAKSNGQRGKQFEQDILETFKNAGAFAEKFPDKVIHRGPDLPPISVEGPPDIIALLKGVGYMIECKARNLSHAKNLEISRLKDHQEDALVQFARNGGKAYVGILWYGTTNASIDTVCFLVPIAYWRKLKLLNPTRKSFNINDMVDGIGSEGVMPLHWMGRKSSEGPWSMRGKRQEMLDV